MQLLVLSLLLSLSSPVTGIVVDPSGRLAGPPPDAVHIAGTGSVGAGRYRRNGPSVLVAPAVVESFAVGFVDRELKGTSLRGNR